MRVRPRTFTAGACPDEQTHARACLVVSITIFTSHPCCVAHGLSGQLEPLKLKIGDLKTRYFTMKLKVLTLQDTAEAMEETKLIIGDAEHDDTDHEGTPTHSTHFVSSSN